MNEDLPKLLRAIANSEVGKKCSYDIICNAAADELIARRADARRLDFLEQEAKKSRTGISFDWIPNTEERGGWRFMRFHFIGDPKGTIRGAIDFAAALITYAQKT